MRSWPKPQKLRQKRRLPRLRPQQLVLLIQEQHHRLLADRDLLAGVKRQRRTARIFGGVRQAAECNRLAACAPQSLQSQIANLESRINDARVAELADAPDLGLQNHRFQSVASRFKTKSLHDRKTPNFPKILHSANPEQKTRHSSTNSRTRTHRSHAHVRLIIGGGCRTS